MKQKIEAMGYIYLTIITIVVFTALINASIQ
jgi:hypothetical protein